MISNLSSSALNLMNTAQHKAADAAHTIATSAMAKDEVGRVGENSNNLIKPLLSLKEAEIESSAAVKILATEDEILGSLFDAMS